MDQYAARKLGSKIDIDQLCRLIDESTFGLKINSSSRISSPTPSYQIKAFHSTRLKRLNSSIMTKSNSDEHENCSSLSNRFHLLSTTNLPPPPTRPMPPKVIEENLNSSCNMEELAAYFDDFLHLPKSLSSAAELMYT